ncbi:AAA family ATPase [Micromonospora sp. PSH03]|uniref:DnaB-like helicase C-terminal domain-containing protein n=1 Tax=Micromonospora salmantinae TaxID=2911211 RepID=UPI001EE7E256|nr:DnaB-like helicase C-terminal domain-containing protein [Micromonospora salmantinae]MCG5459601.1 AAA family ATPase [Micromonospora salmantinae]
MSKGSAGDPLPTVFKTLAAESVHIRRGQFTLIAAAPGVGKSVFALSIALRAGSPAFYASADTDAFTMYLRAGAMVTGWQTGDIENAVEHRNTSAVDAHLEKLNHIRLDFSGRIEVDALEEELQAYAATYGEWPHSIWIDNLSNLDLPDAGEGYLALEAACDYLHELARETGAAVVALHHVTGTFDDGITPVPMSGLRGKVSKVPETILTLYRDATTGTDEIGRLYVCPVKNRTGKADPSGAWHLPLLYEPPRMKLADIPATNTDGGREPHVYA